MRKLMLLASAAILLSGQAALAQGKGQGGGGHGAEHGGKGQGSGDGKGRGQGGGGGQGKESGQAARDDKRGRGQGHGRDDVARAREDRGGGRGPKVQDRGRGSDRAVRVERVDSRDRLVVVDRRDRIRVVPALAPGCPPGLARKANGCLPPGQARKIYGDPYTSLFRYAPWYDAAREYDWRYMNGYAYRLDPASGLVNAFLPLLGGSLFPGSVWPTGYNDYAIDPYYPRYYGYGYGDDWDDYDYRYVDGALYAVDPRTQRIDSITGLLAGDPWTVGQRMPPGYYSYNVPPPYRSRYYDSPTDWYRYSDGYIYRVDPTTQLISAAISLLA